MFLGRLWEFILRSLLSANFLNILHLGVIFYPVPSLCSVFSFHQAGSDHSCHSDRAENRTHQNHNKSSGIFNLFVLENGLRSQVRNMRLFFRQTDCFIFVSIRWAFAFYDLL